MDIKLVNSYLKLSDIFYEKSLPRKVKEPELVVFNRNLAKELGKDIENLEENVEFLVGNNLNKGIEPISLAYAGHQFGHFTMLGDGRAHLLGQYISPNGKFDLQLKGSGPTRFSRGGDGLATLGYMLREYIISEALYSLGVATTRSLSVVKTGDLVARQSFEDGAVLLRLAKSHIRVGSFEYAKYLGDRNRSKELADFVIEEDDEKDELKKAENPYLRLLETVIERQAKLIAKWVSLGLIHGVMNTDNMLISGESIDFGPIAFMDIYNPETVFSSIDRYGRYSYKNQKDIGLWNLYRFAATLLELLGEDEKQSEENAKIALSKYISIFDNEYYIIMAKRIGIENLKYGDKELIDDFLSILEENSLDYHNSFLDLIDIMQDKKTCNVFTSWTLQWKQRMEEEDKSADQIVELMKSINPAIIPRNSKVEEAISAAEEGDYNKTFHLLELLERPYEHSRESREYMIKANPTLAGAYKTYCGT